MHNELLKLGPVTIYGYGLMIAIGILAAYLTAEYRAKKWGLDSEKIFSLTIWAVIGGILGSKSLYYITQFKEILEDPSFIVRTMTDGFVIYGAIIGGIVGVILFCRKNRVSFLPYFDLAVPSVALAQGFGRLGCYLAGCCYGKETESGFHIIFRSSAYAPNNVPLVPTQLISSGLDFLHYALLLYFAKKWKRGDGQVAGLYLVCYSVGRFLLEFFRGDLERGNVGALSTSQFIAIFMFLFGGVLLFWFGRRKQRTEEK